ncbi:hypothetical protein ACFFHM_01165 [Halalkalibacter kiskunsagensis]|uniref:Yip1 domain-containing protein n=1 Tax=Halalkalibacter kiskunsagensis TaxID=1548599 RepID=A0ABV6K7B3_9BACI
MTFRLELYRSLKDPDTKFHQLKIAEVVPISLGKISFILFLSLIVSCIQAYFALSTASLSHLIADYSASEFELAKLLIGFGGIIDAIVSPLTYLLFTSVWFWIFLDNVRFRQSFVVNTISVFIFTIGKVILLPFEIWLGVNSVTSPFALGVVTHLFTMKEYLIYFFGHLSVFLLWSIIIQIYAFQRLATNRKVIIVLVTVSVHLIIILFAVFLQYLVNFFTLN